MKKILFIPILIFLILVIFILNINPVFNKKQMEIGDYIQFGKYNNEPILWRVINIDDNGNVLILSDRIICFKAFDSKGTYHSDEFRLFLGSNYWKDSNIRQWLNSNDNKYHIKWIQNSPSKENVLSGLLPYENEKGFLADGNFNKSERSVIKSVMHKSILHDTDIQKITKGEKNLRVTLRGDLKEAVAEYDSVYYENTEDKVFLLSLKELYEYVYKNRSLLGEDYIIAKPTKESIKQIINELPEKPFGLNTESGWDSFLRSPSSSTPSFVRVVKDDGSIGDGVANSAGHGGIRPALTLDSLSIYLKGAGTKSNPFIVKVKNK